MAIPKLPAFYNMDYVTKDGKLSPQGCLYHDQNFQSLDAQILLSNSITSTTVSSGTVTVNGINPPGLTTAQIMSLSSSSTIAIGTIWYNSSISKLQFKVSSGVIQTVTST